MLLVIIKWMLNQCNENEVHIAMLYLKDYKI